MDTIRKRQEMLRTEFPDDKHTAWAEELMSRHAGKPWEVIEM